MGERDPTTRPWDAWAVLDMTSSWQMWGTSSVSLRLWAVSSTCAQRGGGGLCLPVAYSLGSLVNKPVFVLAMQLFKIGQLNALLFFSGPLVQSFQTNLKDNPLLLHFCLTGSSNPQNICVFFGYHCSLTQSTGTILSTSSSDCSSLEQPQLVNRNHHSPQSVTLRTWHYPSFSSSQPHQEARRV